MFEKLKDYIIENYDREIKEHKERERQMSMPQLNFGNHTHSMPPCANIPQHTHDLSMSGIEGDIFYNNVTGRIYIYRDHEWSEIYAGVSGSSGTSGYSGTSGSSGYAGTSMNTYYSRSASAGGGMMYEEPFTYKSFEDKECLVCHQKKPHCVTIKTKTICVDCYNKILDEVAEMLPSNEEKPFDGMDNLFKIE